MERIIYFKTLKKYLDYNITDFKSINSYFKKKGNYYHIIVGWVQAEKFVKLIPIKFSRQKTIIYHYPQFKHLLK